MAILSKKLRSVEYDFAGHRTGIALWCPGCNTSHAIPTHDDSGGPTWHWDGDVDAPTVMPSIRIVWRVDEQPRVCHFNLTAGQIEYLPDSTHKLAGQTVALPDWPDPTEGEAA